MERKCEHCSVFSAQCDDEKRGRGKEHSSRRAMCVCACACVQNETEFPTGVEVSLEIKTVSFSLLL